ncbi:inorganic phosphate transporter [Acidobacteria bacterium AH-259-D05]|nr:inorganic phosphate transporter [Acidobacteria bacterium AH-259-D05]
MLIALLFTAILLAYANGANDNFKGVATLFGSQTSDYRKALHWACWSTLAGSISAVWIARGLLSTFSGKGLVPDAIAASPLFLTSVGLGAAATVLVATYLGLPISTTHALTGALVGAGMVHAAGQVSFSYLGSAFFAPLLISPLLASISAVGIYLLFRMWRLSLGINKESCVCIGRKIVHSELVPAMGESLFKPIPLWQPKIGSNQYCQHTYMGNFLGIPVAELLDKFHYLSAGAVGFARGLNDTPKIAALLVAGSVLMPINRYAVVALFIALGGWLSARRVAETMSHKITAMNPGQGFSANLVTSLLVIGASRLGMPVSTTHVSVGSLFGIGLLSGNANKGVMVSIISSWLGTLPLAALLAGTAAWILGTSIV